MPKWAEYVISALPFAALIGLILWPHLGSVLHSQRAPSARGDLEAARERGRTVRARRLKGN